MKPEWLEDELLALASAEARVLSIALMLLADDYGNGRANPILLGGQVFPGKLPEVAAKALDELRVLRFVELYEVDGQRYFAIRNWDKHQRVDKPGKNRVPKPSTSTPGNHGPNPVAPIVPATPDNIPETDANITASRGSEVQVEVQVVATVPGPDPDPSADGAARDIEGLAKSYLRDPFSGSLAAIGGALASKWPEVLAVCEAFRAAWGKDVVLRNELKDPRLRVILERFADGFTVNQLERAIRQSKFADYIAGNQAHQTLTTILRDAAQVDKFGGLTALPKKPGETKPKQPNGGDWRPNVEE